MKPKSNKASAKTGSSAYDNCQTPSYGVTPLLQYIPRDSFVWECAAGKGYIANQIDAHLGSLCLRTDITVGADFLTWKPEIAKMTIITNPPYSTKAKYGFIRRCYELDQPFALLVPFETLAAGNIQDLLWLPDGKPNFEVMTFSERIDFEMPELGYTGSGAQFPTCWLTRKLLPQQFMHANITKEKQEFIASLPLEQQPIARQLSAAKKSKDPVAIARIYGIIAERKAKQKAKIA